MRYQNTYNNTTKLSLIPPLCSFVHLCPPMCCFSVSSNTPLIYVCPHSLSLRFLPTFLFDIQPVCLSFCSPSPDKLMRRAHLRGLGCVRTYLSHYHLIITPRVLFLHLPPSPSSHHHLITLKHKIMFHSMPIVPVNQSLHKEIKYED